MSTQEKESLVIQYLKQPSDDLKEQIVIRYRPLVEFVARRLTYNREDLDDVIQVGTIGLLRALERFDPSLENDFSTFATPNIIGEIRHYFRDKRGLVRIPRKLQELYSKVRRYIKECQASGHSPTVDDIAKHFQEDPEYILEAMEAGYSTSVVSLDNPNYKSGADRRFDSMGQSLLDGLGIEHQEDFMINKEILKQALLTLNKRENKIIYLRYYTGLSQSEIARDIGVSQMHVSRLLTNALKRLRKAFDKLGAL